MFTDHEKMQKIIKVIFSDVMREDDAKQRVQAGTEPARLLPEFMWRCSCSTGKLVK